jgi:LacI family transcriptional regulator
MKKRTTIRDVAAHAGVSAATVSNVLNGKQRFGAETHARIRQAMEDLHFTPNGLIRALQTRRTHVIGTLIGGMELLNSAMPDPTTQPILAGIYRGADAANQDILLYTGWPSRPERSNGSDFLDGRVDGLLWLNPEPHSTALEKLTRANLPVVAILSRLVPDGVGYVDTDNIAGMREIVAHVIAQGHRRIAYIGPAHSSNFIDRFTGYRLALSDAGIPLDSALTVHANEVRYMEVAFYGQVLDGLLRLSPPPTALIVATDNWANVMASAIAERGLRVPEDLALTGFDGALLTETLCGGLTTARQPFVEIGQRAVALLLEMIGGAPASDCRVTLPVELIQRNSTAVHREKQ